MVIVARHHSFKMPMIVIIISRPLFVLVPLHEGRISVMVSASAPGKVILFGEHAVVHGIPAIAAPVSSVRATCTIDPQPPYTGITLSAPSLPVGFRPIDFAQPADAFSQTLRLAFRALRTAFTDARLTLTSDIPIASGMGSGAAIAAAMMRAISAYLNTTLPPDRLNALIYEVEKLHHGTPSGIDNTVIVYERVIGFQRQHPVIYLPVARPFMLLIGDTGHAASTREAVAGVHALRAHSPEQVTACFDEIREISLQARRLIAHPDGSLYALGELMNRNHSLLQALTVSSPALDMLTQVARDAGAFGAKLSGGGRGGIMIALVDAARQDRVRQALVHAGAVRVFSTIVQ
jgi:mevalonate kinase